MDGGKARDWIRLSVPREYSVVDAGDWQVCDILMATIILEVDGVDLFKIKKVLYKNAVRSKFFLKDV
jgi:hypothetical protein